MKIGFLEDSWLNYIVLEKFIKELGCCEVKGYHSVDDMQLQDNELSSFDILFIGYKNNTNYYDLLHKIVNSKTKIFLCYDRDKFDYTLPAMLASRCYVILRPYNSYKLQKALALE